jgi:hypothetical protein
MRYIHTLEHNHNGLTFLQGDFGGREVEFFGAYFDMSGRRLSVSGLSREQGRDRHHYEQRKRSNLELHYEILYLGIGDSGVNLRRASRFATAFRRCSAMQVVLNLASKQRGVVMSL